MWYSVQRGCEGCNSKNYTGPTTCKIVSLLISHGTRLDKRRITSLKGTGAKTDCLSVRVRKRVETDKKTYIKKNAKM